MKHIVTVKWLHAQDACLDGVARFERVHGQSAELRDVIEGHIADNTLDWANWLVIRKMTRRQAVAYAVYAAKQVIGVYDAEHPAPRVCIDPPTLNQRAAWAAERAEAAERAAERAEATWKAARRARGFWEAAAATAGERPGAAWEAAREAWAATGAAGKATGEAARAAMQIKILRYGLSLIYPKVST